MQSLAEIPIGRLQLQEATVYVNTKQPNTRNIYLTKYHDVARYYIALHGYSIFTRSKGGFLVSSINLA